MVGNVSRRSVLGGIGALGLAVVGAAGRASAAPIAAPRMVVTRKHAGIAPGKILYTSGGSPVIADADGAPVWSTSSGQQTSANFQVQQYRGESVLTWWQGSGGPANGGVGTGTDVLTTLDHRPVATIGPSGDYHPDTHELRLTPEGTALITSYRTVPHDLSPVGGPVDGKLRNAFCEEVDIASGRVLHRWSAIDHVPLSDSYRPLPVDPRQPYDFFHLNSISLTPDGHLLLSSRHTCALYKVHRTSGEILWTLGGKSSTFRVDRDAVFGFQHHAVFEDDSTIRLFDDGSDETATWHFSRVAWVRLDTARRTASLADSMSIPGVRAYAMGSAQRLPNGNVFVSWGSAARLTEFSPAGEVLFDARLPQPSYRAFKVAL